MKARRAATEQARDYQGRQLTAANNLTSKQAARIKKLQKDLAQAQAYARQAQESANEEAVLAKRIAAGELANAVRDKLATTKEVKKLQDTYALKCAEEEQKVRAVMEASAAREAALQQQLAAALALSQTVEDRAADHVRLQEAIQGAFQDNLERAVQLQKEVDAQQAQAAGATADCQRLSAANEKLQAKAVFMAGELERLTNEKAKLEGLARAVQLQLFNERAERQAAVQQSKKLAPVTSNLADVMSAIMATESLEEVQQAAADSNLPVPSWQWDARRNSAAAALM